MVVTAVTLLLLLNDTYKLESLQEDGSRTSRRFLKQPAANLEPVIVVFNKESHIPTAGTFH